MKGIRTIQSLVLLVMLAGCSEHDIIDDTLPEGKYPMSFTATVGELEVSPQSAPHSKAATRAADQLPMRISIDNGANYTDYTLSAGDGSLAPTNVGKALYWTKNTAQVNAYTAVTIGSGGIDIADQSNGWGMLGYVGVVPAKTYTFRKASIALTLQPATAKVNINLVAGAGVSEAELSAATVVLSGYTQAILNANGLVGSGTNSAITPKGSNKAFEALLVPQQMQGKRFVRVTFGGLNYYYTPTNATDANLTAGKQYTYTITVNKGGITVTASGATEWTGTTSDVTSDEIFAPANLKIGDYYYSDGTWSDGGLRKLYADGTIEKEDVEPDLKGGRTVIGIVFKVGRDVSGNWKDDCTYTLKDGTTPMSTIHGYVLALYDASGGSYCTWGPTGTQVNHADMNRDQNTDFYGYKNTNAIKAFAQNNGKTLQTDFPATYYATVDYETRENGKYAAPANSSGWFLPSAGQGQYWLNNRDVLLTSVKKATNEPNYNWARWYWSSSEFDYYPANYAWVVDFNYGNVSNDLKYGGNNVRSVFAF